MINVIYKDYSEVQVLLDALEGDCKMFTLMALSDSSIPKDKLVSMTMDEFVQFLKEHEKLFEEVKRQTVKVARSVHFANTHLSDNLPFSNEAKKIIEEIAIKMQEHRGKLIKNETFPKGKRDSK